MKLSVLICTIPERRTKFIRLRAFLRELSEGMPVEILEHMTKKTFKGGPSIGAKRQELLERAQGEYIVFIDDDDMVSKDYFTEILRAIDQSPDCIGFKIQVSGMGRTSMASASMKYKDWKENVDDFRYVRSTYHKTPVRRDLAVQIGFKDMRLGEDADYSIRLMASGLLKKEVYIDKVLYFYRYSAEPALTKYGFK